MNPKTHTQLPLENSAAKSAESPPATGSAAQQKRTGRKAADRKCSVEGCERKHWGRGFCRAHHARWEKGQSLSEPIRNHDKTGPNNPKWKGGIITDGRGRFLIYSPNHPNPSMFGTHVYRYRLVVEKYIGRFLKKEEIVHHKNGNYSDDRIKNLQVMTQSEHARLHMLDRHARQRKAQTI